MDLNQTEQSALAQWFKGDISLRSLILHSVGCVFIGTPDGLNMPSDFYFIEGDRHIPHPNAYEWGRQRELLFVDTFRRILTEKLAKWCLAIAMSVFLGGLMVQGLATGVKAAYHQGERAYDRVFRKGATAPLVSEMTSESAANRLHEIRSEYMELNKPPIGDSEKSRIQALEKEAKEILMKYPSLSSIVQGY